MKKSKTFWCIILAIIIITLFVMISFAKSYEFDEVNFCDQTIEEANNYSNWHDGVYSPEGCDLSKYTLEKTLKIKL